ncbi:hypothetical protein [Streptomyces drozdowiczii]|uniref:Uncharacterized protein n=1 Tax=Streptomyces drozdowiczii TaxID=202862 RepID=A0ABY6PRZ2_9ACTN|nr:hypothetical protein [Streptomyces drozdowiczii]MCX0245798.1 hypothetical protein [Streptomyces drozdowiczii]UZK54606.1 hypothetical protein NEH16_11055 [Streptomyces drozdowiczii]
MAPDDAGSRGDEVNPRASVVTKLLCQSMYARPDRLKPIRAWWRKLLGKGDKPEKPRRSARRRIYLEGSDDCPPLGEQMAQWVVDHVVHGPPLPVPSYGFDLEPVAAHGLRVRRRRWARRAALLLVFVAVASVAPWASAVWGTAALLALFLRWAAARAERKPRAVGRSSRPGLAYLVLCLPWLLAVVPYAWPIGGQVIGIRLELVFAPFVLLIGGAVVFAADRLVARASLGRIVGGEIASGRLPWVAPKGKRRIARLKDGQGLIELPYDVPERFVGAGRYVWGIADMIVPLKPKSANGAVEPFEDRELLARMREALRDLGRGPQEITEPLPGFTASDVVGLPSDLWLRRARNAKAGEPKLRGRGRQSPSSVPDRLYMRAQCVTWDGEVVVTVFVHAALEGGELHLTVRPHVVTPVYNELRGTDAPLALRHFRLLRWLTVQSLLDAVVGPLAAWRFAARFGRGPAKHLEESGGGRGEEKDPVSVRDRYSMEEVTDMHQSDDAKRHVVLMQTCVFRTVAEYLEELGVDTAPYEQQVAAVITNIQVYGDNHAPIQNVAGSNISGVSQGSAPQGGK